MISPKTPWQNGWLDSIVCFPGQLRAGGDRRRAGQSAMCRLLDTFFDGSLADAVAAHIVDPAADHSPDELKRLAALIREARKKMGE